MSTDAGKPSKATLLQATQTERRALATDLDNLTPEQWAQPSLCSDWTVEQVVAHLTADASIGQLPWMASVIGARFDFDLHNLRRLTERLGPDPAATLARFRTVLDSTTSILGPKAAWLGEVVVHAEDIRRPLGLVRTPPSDTLLTLARFYAGSNFTVPGKTTISGLRVEATDTTFATGSGPVVSGPTLSLIMVMAGRQPHLADLEGDGLAILRDRLESS